MPACAKSTWGRAVADPLLALADVRAGYGDAVVLDGISLEIAEGGSVAVLGRNGMGKTTVTRGALLWRGASLAGMPSHRRARRGLAWVAQEREIFPSLTLEEN